MEVGESASWLATVWKLRRLFAAPCLPRDCVCSMISFALDRTCFSVKVVRSPVTNATRTRRMSVLTDCRFFDHHISTRGKSSTRLMLLALSPMIPLIMVMDVSWMRRCEWGSWTRNTKLMKGDTPTVQWRSGSKLKTAKPTSRCSKFEIVSWDWIEEYNPTWLFEWRVGLNNFFPVHTHKEKEVSWNWCSFLSTQCSYSNETNQWHCAQSWPPIKSHA